MANRLPEKDPRLSPLREALQASDEEGAVRSLVGALNAGATPRQVERTILRVMAQDGEALHSMLQVSAVFDIAGGLGADAGRYILAAGAVQIARQPKNSRVADLLQDARATMPSDSSPASAAGAEQRLGGALDQGDTRGAIAAALALHRLSPQGAHVLEAFASWGARPEVIVEPVGYVTHLPLQTAAALDLWARLESPEDFELLLAHLAYCQVELAKKYKTRPVEAELEIGRAHV